MGSSRTKGLCIHQLLEDQASRNPNSVALLAPGRQPISYGRLWKQVRETAEILNGHGFGKGHRIALVLPNGPEMAASFLSLSTAAACVPFNPACRTQEFESYFANLLPSALIIQAGEDSPSREVARARGIPVIELLPHKEEPAGVFSLKFSTPPRALRASAFTCADDVALVLHTSGTTSQPKIVPLTQANLCHSAANIRNTLRLDASDRCLNVMPLFHIHGLVGALLSSLSAGGSVVCSPGFLAPKFFEWIDEFRPTWYTAVPTMHQSIVARGPRNREIIARSPLRFVRSSSAALPRRVMHQLEEVFHVPVIEAYGMTEAAHQMASNPLGPGKQKPGSVGIASGPEVAVMDEQGGLLGPDLEGDVVVRGPNVMRGYEGDPASHASGFLGGWFRTGDRGWLDAEGYLFLNGRTKEMINRGGEKISPSEVDEVLLEHPAITAALAFALPSPVLGEEVAAAVVLRENASVSESGLREFVAARLSIFKVPRKIVFLDEIPKGPTGKPQRIGLASRLGLATAAIPARPNLASPMVEPVSLVQMRLCELWEELLDVAPIGIRDDFFDLGGDSFLATSMLSRVDEIFGRTIPASVLLLGANIERLASAVETGARDMQSPVVPIRQEGDGPPFFFLHGDYLSGGFYCREIARRIKPHQPFLALPPCGFDGRPVPASYRAMAERHLDAIRTIQPHGPYLLGGECNGGLVAYEIARLMEARGDRVSLLALLSASAANVRLARFASFFQVVGSALRLSPVTLRYTFRRALGFVGSQRNASIGDLLRRLPGKRAAIVRELRRLARTRAHSDVPALDDGAYRPEGYRERLREIYRHIDHAYQPGRFGGRVTLICGQEELPDAQTERHWWQTVAAEVEVFTVPGGRRTKLTRHVGALADVLNQLLDRTSNESCVRN